MENKLNIKWVDMTPEFKVKYNVVNDDIKLFNLYLGNERISEDFFAFSGRTSPNFDNKYVTISRYAVVELSDTIGNIFLTFTVYKCIIETSTGTIKSHYPSSIDIDIIDDYFFTKDSWDFYRISDGTFLGYCTRPIKSDKYIFIDTTKTELGEHHNLKNKKLFGVLRLNKTNGKIKLYNKTI